MYCLLFFLEVKLFLFARGNTRRLFFFTLSEWQEEFVMETGLRSVSFWRLLLFELLKDWTAK